MQAFQSNSDNLLVGIKLQEKEIHVKYITESADNLRVFFDKKEIGQLADHISKNGLIYPLVAHKVSKNTYEIIDGHRRFRAIKSLDMKTVTCRVCEYPLSREQIHALMVATDKFPKPWSKYDLAKKCAILIRETGSLNVASARMLMSTQQFRMYAMIGELPGKLLQRMIDYAVPYTFAHVATIFFATNILCKRLSMTKDEVVRAVIEKWISKKIKSINDFQECIKKVPMLKDEDLKHWLVSDLGLDVLKAMVETLPERNEKMVESINKSLGQVSRRIREYTFTFEEARQVQDQLALLQKEIKRVVEGARRKEKSQRL
jgi:ParB/RepB/Spo0J family partition protein